MDYKRKNSFDATEDVPVKMRYTGLELQPYTLMHCIGSVSRSWRSDTSLDRDNVHVSTLPFKHCVIKNFIDDEKYLKELKKELLDLEFLTKRNDLYQFHQSMDLASIDKPHINCLLKFLKGECRAWLQSATGIVLNSKISSTCSSYIFSDHLLCHDDKCEDRRIAFVLYLNENWLPEFGGALELFSTDDCGQPDKVVSAIQPTYNSFVFFEVTNESFHQVAEVKARDRTRLSINGWFHGSLSARKPAKEDRQCRSLFLPKQVTDDVLSHVNSMYLRPEVQRQISTSFEQNSEILLPDFFESNFYDDLCKCLTSDDLTWKMEGPANKRKYETLIEQLMPQQLEEVIQLFMSEQFFQLLGKLTKLNLATDDEDCIPSCSYQVERWQSGFYTLLHETENRKDYALDVILYCNVQQTKQLQGGSMTYVADNADEELLTLVPGHNALALAFRDKRTNRFVKYINNLFDNCFHVISCTYYEGDDTL